jgi:hypothetical protein
VDFYDTVSDSALAPPVGKPNIYYVNQDGEDGVEQKVYPCPEAGPYNQLHRDHGIQTRKADNTHAPHIDINTRFVHYFVFLHHIKWYIVDDERVNNSQNVDADVVCPVKDGVLRANVIELWIKLTYLLTFFLVVHVLLESGFDEERPRCKEKIVERNVVVIKNSLTTETILEGKH